MMLIGSLESDESIRALGRVIGLHASEIGERWMRRVREDISRRPDLDPSCHRIAAHLTALEYVFGGSTREIAERCTSWIGVAREHGIACVRIGYDIEQLIQELIALRHVIDVVAVEHHVHSTATETILADVIDTAIAESARAYVEARDHETRQAQVQTIGFLTHELRNPLATAVGAAGMLRTSASARQARALDALERSHGRLVDLIDGVLDAERLQAGKVEPKVAGVREGDLLDRAVEAARDVARRKQLAFEIASESERRLVVDPDLTRSAIQNLVDNAVKYTDQGRVHVDTALHGGAWSIHVRDTCPGLSAAELRTIFEPFRRGSTTKSGTGLGLAIARRAIEAQGGSIGVESSGPLGCHFWITLPQPVCS
jgi:two-component system, OmpR family, sensor histidine kinase TorS